MATLSARLDNRIMAQTKHYAASCNLGLSEYTRLAIEKLNQAMEKKQRYQRLQQASIEVRDNSHRINQEFDQIEFDVDD